MKEIKELFKGRHVHDPHPPHLVLLTSKIDTLSVADKNCKFEEIFIIPSILMNLVVILLISSIFLI